MQSFHGELTIGHSQFAHPEKMGEAAVTAPSLETDIYGVHLQRGKNGGSRGGQLGLTARMALIQPRGKGGTDTT